MVIVGDVLVTKIIEKVIDVGFSYLVDQCTRHTSMKDELQRLNDALPRIQAVVRAADNAVQMADSVDNPHLQAWLQQLIDVLYEADDVLDELDYLQLQKQMEGDTSLDERHHKVRRLLSHVKENIMRIFKSDPTFEKLRSAVKRLDEVAAHVGEFFTLVSSVQQFQYLQNQSRTMTSHETGPLVTESTVLGRDSEREELLQWLMKGQPDQAEKNNVSLYSVVGHGGMGKTTLAQLVYNDENVQKSFDLKMWVCVSTSFDVRQITAAMLESAMKKRPEIDNLATLQNALKEKLMSSNKFLLVLDDVWNDENCSNWDRLLAPLKYGHKGSKILLTTRMNKVTKEAVRAMDGSTKESMQLNRIHGNDFFTLFNRYAFAGITSNDYKELQPIGMQIAQRLGGSPLAAKTIGVLLNSNLDERYWTSILHCKNISDQGQQREGNIMSILMLSYHHLPLYLRPCFAFCSSFPQDHEFEKEDLVLKWMALGLIQHSAQNQGLALEDIGSYYFDELFNRSFFEQKRGFQMCTYITHDLLHDVARSVSHGGCFSIVNDDKSVEDIPNTVRHLYLATNNLNLVTMVDKWQQLRSLQLRINSRVLPELAEVLEKVFKSLKCVRILEVCVYGMRVLPDVFGHLIHLRSLTIANYVDEFPASLCKLHNLQVLKFLYNISFVLPDNMKDLVSLRHLLTSREQKFFPEIARVRKLSSLQQLHISIKKERDYKIDELKGLNMIRELHLQGLENVESPKEASMAKLGNKVHLRVLTLEWRPDNDNERNNPKMDEQEQILDCLQPHSSLKELAIKRYEGVRPAKWMDFELVNNLQRISLSDCSRLEHLPSFRKLPYLKYLYLSNMPLVKQLDCDCQQLEELELFNMEGLEELSQTDANSGQWCPRLRKLKIQYSPKLSVFPSFSFGKLPFLKYLYLTSMPLVKQLDCDCQQLEELYLNNMEGLEVLSQLDANSGQWCPCLLQLRIENSPKLSVLPSLSPSLQYIILRNVGLTDLPKLWLGSEGSSLFFQFPELEIVDPNQLTESLRNLTSVEKLYIANCSKLESISGQMEEWLLQRRTTLNSITLDNASSLKSLPDSLQTFSSLEKLTLLQTRQLQSVPQLPSSVEILSIWGCNETLKDRCRKDEGADWPNIKHIQHIYLG